MLGHAPLSDLAISDLVIGGGPYPPGPPAFLPAVQPQPYDLIGAFDVLLPGYFFEKPDWDAMYAAWAAAGFIPLTSPEALAYVFPEHGPQPPPLASIRQLRGIDEAPEFMNPAGVA